jgi:brassinosteroid-6-oxidase 2
MIMLNIGIVQKEHFAIRERKKPEDPIDCNDLKSMRFTRAVRSVL